MGRPPYFVAQRLCGWAIINWPEFDGSQAEDPLELPFDRLLSRIYFTLVNGVTGKEREQFELRLSTPPRLPGRRRRGRRRSPAEAGFDAETAAAAFAAAEAATVAFEAGVRA